MEKTIWTNKYDERSDNNLGPAMKQYAVTGRRAWLKYETTQRGGTVSRRGENVMMGVDLFHGGKWFHYVCWVDAKELPSTVNLNGVAEVEIHGSVFVYPYKETKIIAKFYGRLDVQRCHLDRREMMSTEGIAGY